MRHQQRNTGRRGPSIERKLDMILCNQYKLMRALNVMEIMDMAKWDSMVAAVEHMRGREASMQEVFSQLNQKISELQTNMTDEDDQAKVEEFAAAFNDVASRLPQAIVANPAPSDTGGSQAGIKRNE